MSEKRKPRRQICLKFTDSPADWLVWQHIKKQPNIAAYIRRLVWRDIECQEAQRYFEEEAHDAEDD